VRFPYSTQNLSGIAPLVAGPATLNLTLSNDATSAMLDSKSIAVTFVSPYRRESIIRYHPVILSEAKDLLI
jgi:hypothetical protein